MMVKVNGRESTVLKTPLLKTDRKIAAKHYALPLNHWLQLLDPFATVMSDV